MKVLVLGYGRAGKRHARYLHDYWDAEIVTADPYVAGPDEHYEGLAQALHAGNYDYAVVATPPDQHIQQVQYLIDAHIPTLCEKPLCALGQLEEAKRLPRHAAVMVAYNYRFHPALLRAMYQPKPPNACWHLIARQYREALPSWGLLLDHCSHDLDTVGFMSGGITSIQGAEHYQNNLSEAWEIHGQTRHGPFSIHETVMKEPCAREARLITTNSTIEIDAPQQMYYTLLFEFLHEEYCPDLTAALETQEWLEGVSQWRISK